MDHDTTSTVLICGHREDPVVEALLDRSDELRLDTVFVTEEQLFTSYPFALVRHGRIVRCYIAVDGRIIDLQRLAGAIVRMPRAWRPSDEFDLKDQMLKKKEHWKPELFKPELFKPESLKPELSKPEKPWDQGLIDQIADRVIEKLRSQGGLK